MLNIAAALALSMMAQVVWAEDPAASDKAPVADVAEKTPATETTAAVDTKEEEFKPPRGFKTKKRGDLTLYCQTAEKCYNEEQLRADILVLKAQRRDVDRIRTNCGGGPCTPFEPGMPR